MIDGMRISSAFRVGGACGRGGPGEQFPLLRIPTGFRLEAPGWRVREPTLGPCPNEIINRNAVVTLPLSRPRATLAATALRLKNGLFAWLTQGSSCLATLGFETQSLWD